MPYRWLWMPIFLCLVLAASAAAARTRIALVVGNANYVNTPALANPVNDADDVAKALTAAGFKVTLKENLGKRDFDLALAQFTRDARDAEAALFYYAGHGMQFHGVNYLMPVDASLQDEVSLRYEMVSVDDVKLALDNSAGVKILVLDSCRDNPLANRLMRSLSGAGRSVSVGHGLAPAEPTPGMIIVYATQSGRVALDGAGRNGPFAEAFAKELAKPGLEVATLFREVAEKVVEATDGQQSPEISISGVPQYFITDGSPEELDWTKASAAGDADALIGFLSRYPSSPHAKEAREKLAAAQGARAGDDVEALFWQSTEKGGAISDYANYLKTYPNGAFASIAISRIAKLAAKPAPTPSAPASAGPRSPPAAQAPPSPAPSPTAPEAAPKPAPVAAAPPRETPAAARKPRPHPGVVHPRRPKAAERIPIRQKERAKAAKARPADDSAPHSYCAPGFTKIPDPKNPFGFGAFICAPK